MEHNAYSWRNLTQMIPADHRYVVLRRRLQPLLESLEFGDDHMLWMMVLQICDGLSETNLLTLLPENFYMRWLCGYGLCDPIANAVSYSEYKRSVSAFKMVRLVKAVMELDVNGNAFLSMMNMLLDESAGNMAKPDGDRPYFVLVSERSELLVEEIMSAPNLELIYVRCEGALQHMAVAGSEDQLAGLLRNVTQTAIGAAEGYEWTSTLARAESAFRELQIYGERGYLLLHQERQFRIVNLTLVDKRLALENFLKDSSLEQAYSLFEDIVGRLGKRARDLHWMQLRHELIKLCCALYNGGFHYQQSPHFFIDYSTTMEKMMRCSFDEAVSVMRDILHSFDVQKFQEIIGVGLMDYASAAREMIEKHYASDLTLGSTARQFGITPEYLSGIFRKSVGRNFVEYLTDVRIEHACKLLTFSGTKINEVAHMVGFANPDYFGKVFKQKMHMTPRQYQKNKA